MRSKRTTAAVGLGVVGALVLAGCDLGAAPVTYELDDDLTSRINPNGMDTGDVDGDGDLDVAVTGSGGMGFVLLMNDGTGTFVNEPGRTTHVGDSRTPSLADIDGDDDLDLVTGASPLQWSDAVPTVTRNDGTGRFPAAEQIGPIPGPGELTAVVPSDADGDGDVDLLASMRVAQERHVAVYANDGTGTFASPVTYPLGLATDRATPIHLVAGDLDSDGDDDLVATDVVTIDDPDLGSVDETHAMVALNDGTGAFTAVGTPFRVGRVAMVYALTPALADFDEDGHLDLTVGGDILLGDGAGGFGPISESPTPPSYDFVATGDVDGDGHADIVGFDNVLQPKNGTVAYGDGLGTITAVHKVVTGTDVGGGGAAARHVELADIDADGDPDVLFLAGSLGVVENVDGGRAPA